MDDETDEERGERIAATLSSPEAQKCLGRYEVINETEADGTSERVPEVFNQDDTPLLGGNVTHPRLGHLTEFERKTAAYKYGRRIGSWLPWLLLAVGAVIWLVVCVIPWK